MTLFAGEAQNDRPPRSSRPRQSSSLRAKTNQAKRQPTPRATPTTPTAGGPLALSPTSQALYDDVAGRWELSPPVLAILRIACEAQTKCEQLEAVTAVEGMTIGDQKGSTKPHPCALLARDYRAQASGALMRLLSHLEK